MNLYLTRHRSRFASEPLPLSRRLWRRWLLFLRGYYFWRHTRHLELSARSLRKRAEVLRQLSLDDEDCDNENGV